MIHEPFKPEHFREIDLQESQAYLLGIADDRYLTNLQNGGPAFTLRHQGRVLLCGGLILADGSALLWAFLSRDARRYLLAVTRYVQRFLQVYPCHQYRATVEVDYPQGCKWLRILGFLPVEHLKAYGPDGRDHLLYMRGAT